MMKSKARLLLQALAVTVVFMVVSEVRLTMNHFRMSMDRWTEAAERAAEVNSQGVVDKVF